MATTLRDLLIQRAARLQEHPALVAPGWGHLSYFQLRNRVEGLAFGLLARGGSGPFLSQSGTAWDWIAELAVAASGLTWEDSGQLLPLELYGGAGFHDEAGRGLYHAQEKEVGEDTPFRGELTHGLLMGRLRRLNGRLGWDHDTRLGLPLANLGTPAMRAALWSLLYAGGCAELMAGPPSQPPWEEDSFMGFWEP